jgi:toxin-antitoxin system PIN domain toxin
MILVDANVLLYAYDATARHHERCRAWLERELSGVAPVAFAWVTLLAFLRIVTNPRVLSSPLSAAEATDIVKAWLERPAAALAEPGDRHLDALRSLMIEGQVKGPLVMDAHLAALAIEHGAALATCDRDCRRFPGVRIVDPTAGEG